VLPIDRPYHRDPTVWAGIVAGLLWAIGQALVRTTVDGRLVLAALSAGLAVTIILSWTRDRRRSRRLEAEVRDEPDDLGPPA